MPGNTPRPDIPHSFPKTRDDDARGTPPGAGTVVPAHGGRIGNPPFIPTAQQRIEVTAWGKAGLQTADIAVLLDVSVRTVERHFGRELAVSKAEMKRAIGGNLTRKALEGNLTAQIFWLRTQAKWNVRVEHVGPDGGPVRYVDLSEVLKGKSQAELATLEPILEQLLAASGSAGIDGGDSVVAPTGAGEDS